MSKLSERRWLVAVLGLTCCIGLPVHGQLVISEVDLINNKVELVNLGTNAVNATTWWWCNRVNGSPFYATISGSTIDTNLSTATSLNVGGGEILVMNVPAGFLPNGNGELGLYNSNSFASTTAMQDYVLWGDVGFRDSVADSKGIWTDNEYIIVTNMTTGDSLQLDIGFTGNDADEYFVGPSSLGVAQSLIVPEETNLVFDVSSLSTTNNTFAVVLLGPTGTVVVIECTSSLTNTWIAVETNSLTGSGLGLSYPITTNAQFYRALTSP